MKEVIKKEITDISQCKAVVIGASAGGIEALLEILPRLPINYPVPVVIVLHIPDDQPSLLVELFESRIKLRVKDADEKEVLQPGTIYFASPGYHLLIERDLTFSLSTEERVQYSRPSIDVLFESTADALDGKVVGVLLTGANQDGAQGLKRIQDSGGLAIIQDPATAEASAMPEAGRLAISASKNQILSLDEIGNLLMRIK